MTYPALGARLYMHDHVRAAGTVTRTSEVRPELFMGCFRCLECGTLVRDVEQQFKFTEPLMCTQTACQNKCAPSQSHLHGPLLMPSSPARLLACLATGACCHM